MIGIIRKIQDKIWNWLIKVTDDAMAGAVSEEVDKMEDKINKEPNLFWCYKCKDSFDCKTHKCFNED